MGKVKNSVVYLVDGPIARGVIGGGAASYLIWLHEVVSHRVDQLVGRSASNLFVSVLIGLFEAIFPSIFSAIFYGLQGAAFGIAEVVASNIYRKYLWVCYLLIPAGVSVGIATLYEAIEVQSFGEFAITALWGCTYMPVRIFELFVYKKKMSPTANCLAISVLYFLMGYPLVIMQLIPMESLINCSVMLLIVVLHMRGLKGDKYFINNLQFAKGIGDEPARR